MSLIEVIHACNRNVNAGTDIERKGLFTEWMMCLLYLCDSFLIQFMIALAFHMHM